MLMNVKSYIPMIDIHPLLMLFIILSILTGTFVQLAIILCIVILHELGHFLAAIHFKWRIQKIVLWVFGGIMKTDEHGSRSLYEEFIVTISGPIQHLFIYFACFLLYMFYILPESIVYLIFYYNTIVLLFNLLPIWPLDGGKLFLLANSLFFPYRQAYEYTIVFALFMSLFLIIAHLVLYPFNLSSLIIIIFLLIENSKAWQQRYFIFMRFLLQRYEMKEASRPISSIVVPFHMPLKDVIQRFYLGKNHLIYIVDQKEKQLMVIEEYECLQLYFNRKYLQQPIGKLVS